MKPLENMDEVASQTVRNYAELNELAIVVRTNGDDVRVLTLDYDKEVLAKMLRIAASMLEKPKSGALN